MAFDEALANRLRPMVAGVEGVTEKRMFGGLAFLLRGNMFVGVHGQELMVRLNPVRAAAALGKPGISGFPPGRPMNGWLLVDAGAIETAELLAAWVDQALRHVRTLPAQ